MPDPSAAAPAAATATEVRVLDGPNLYFTRPAIKVSLALPGYLGMDRSDAAELAGRLGIRSARPGRPGTALRQRFVMRVARHVMRRIGAYQGVVRMGVRVRPGGGTDEIVVAFTWVRRDKAVVAGEQLAQVLQAVMDPSVEPDAALVEASRAIDAVPDGPSPTAITPRVPVVSITGTNGKTTTTRLVAHMCMTAGLTTAWSSTDGIVVMGRTIEPGDYSGPAGARGVLEAPGVQMGILETARGGLLLKGMGVTANDVSVVTNVSADHLGVNGIDTLDQLAEVKAIVTTVTRPQGWAVLNGDDPRVWAMRQGTRAKPWVFTLDPSSPAIWESLNAGGRAVTVVDDVIVIQTANGDPERLVPLREVPMTMFGLSATNIANALAGTAAALGLGVPREAVLEGLRTFAPDPAHNSGRMNSYTLPVAGGSVTVLVDMAHNEAGLEALLEVARGLVVPGSSLRLALGTGGDRTDEMLRGMGRLAARADDGVIKQTPHYLRGRTPENLVRLLQEGLSESGVHVTGEVADNEVPALAMLAERSHAGDVIALMCHEQRPQVEAWLAEHGASADTPAAVRRKVVAARGEHELEEQIVALHDLPDAAERVRLARGLVDAHPGDARLVYELAAVHDAAQEPQEARRHYEAALDSGLAEPFRHRATVSAAVAAARCGDRDGAAALLERALQDRPSLPAALVARAFLRGRNGDPAGGFEDLLTVIGSHPPDGETARLRPWLWS